MTRFGLGSPRITRAAYAWNGFVLGGSCGRSRRETDWRFVYREGERDFVRPHDHDSLGGTTTVRVRIRSARRLGYERDRRGRRTEAPSRRQKPPGESVRSWITPTALTPGSVIATLTTTHEGTGSITVTPASASTPTYFSPISCPVAHVALPGRPFTVSPGPRYAATTHSWRLGVKVSGPGVLSAVEPEPTVGTGGPAQVTGTPLVQTRRIGLKSAGTVTLTLRLTPRGEKKLGGANILHVRLEVTFNPKNGESTSKLVTLTLKKS